jgi:hypothetical protein
MLASSTRKPITAVFTDFNYGEFDPVKYLKQRLNYLAAKWDDGYRRIVQAEREAFAEITADYREWLSDRQLERRVAYRQMLADFEARCLADKTTEGAAREEQHERLTIYEAWLADYGRLLPVQRAHHDARLKERAKRIREAEAAAQRARHAYDEALTTLDELDNLRRQQNRERHRIWSEWHDAVVRDCMGEARFARAMIFTIETERYDRCAIVLEEEEARQCSLGLFERSFLKGCFLAEQWERLHIQSAEEAQRHDNLQRGSKH